MTTLMQEIKYPLTMLTASGLNLTGSFVAIVTGADRNADGKINPFFYTAMTASAIMVTAQLCRINDIINSRPTTHARRLESRSESSMNELMERV